jgi:hypothetical protein
MWRPEPQLSTMMPDGVSLHTTRLRLIGSSLKQLLGMIDKVEEAASQIVVPWTGDASGKPKQADFKAWVDHVCSVTVSGRTHEHRRHPLKALLDEAWRFSNWLTHAKASAWHDAEAATTTVEHALGLATSLVLRHIRGVPHACPACGSTRLSPQRGINERVTDLEWERLFNIAHSNRCEIQSAATSACPSGLPIHRPRERA